MENILRKIRKSCGMSIQELAKLSNVSEVYIYHLENGNRKNPSYEVMKNSPNGIAIIDKEFRIIDINSKAKYLLGLKNFKTKERIVPI